MSVQIDMETQGNDLSMLFEWLAQVTKRHCKTRWSLQLSLTVVKKKAEKAE